MFLDWEGQSDPVCVCLCVSACTHTVVHICTRVLMRVGKDTFVKGSI